MPDAIQQEDPWSCPFCDEAVTRDDVSSDGSDAYVVCPDCCAHGPTATIGCRDPEEDGPIDLEAEAIAAWNDRLLQSGKFIHAR